MNALGRLFDININCVPTDAVAGAVTGKRTHLKNAGGCTFVAVRTGTSSDVLDCDLQQHTAASSGTTADLDIITAYWIKDEATLDGDETWAKVTQSVASEITNAGTASQECILVIEVDATQLSDGYEWVSLDFPDQGTNSTMYVASFCILRDLAVQRAPSRLVEPQG